MKNRILRDRDIRVFLLRKLHNENINKPNTIIMEELGLHQGNSRIDIAVVNGSIHGYEIKSEKDNLNRLPDQIKAYNQICDYMTIVTSNCYLKEVTDMIPKWWGILNVYYEAKTKNISILHKRKPRYNSKVNPESVIQLIWKDEAKSALVERGLHKGFLSKPREDLWEKLIENLTTKEIKALARDCLRSRLHWRPAHLHT